MFHIYQDKEEKGIINIKYLQEINISTKIFLMNHLQLYIDDSLRVLKYNYLDIQHAHIIICHINFLTHYKSL
jgi:hypothetical protein